MSVILAARSGLPPASLIRASIVGNRNALKITLRGALALSLLIHGALLLSGRHAADPVPGEMQAAKRNLQVVVRASALKPTPEPDRRPDASRNVSSAPDAPRSEPSPDGGPTISQRVAAVVETVADRAPVSVTPSRTDALPAGSPATERGRPTSIDRPVSGPSAERTAEATLASGHAVQAPDPADVTAYRVRLATLAGRFKEYPPLARERGLVGVVGVRVRVAPGLAHPEVTLGKSSGVAILDHAAVAMIAKASRTADLPVRLRDRVADIDVPVDYRLD